MKTSSKISRQTKETNQRKVDNNRIPKAIDSAPTNKTAKRKPFEGRGEKKEEEEEAKFGVRLTTVINPSIVSFFYFLPRWPTLGCCR